MILPRCRRLTICGGGGGQSGGGRCSNSPNKLGLSPLNYISYAGPPTAGTTQFWGGIQRLQRAWSLFLLPIRECGHLWWIMSRHNIFLLTSPRRHHRSRILVVLFPLRRHPAPARRPTSSTRTESRGGHSGGGHTSSGGAPAPVAARPTPPVRPAGGPIRSLRGGGGCWRRRWWVISSSSRGGPTFRHFGGPAQTRGEEGLKHTCGCPGCVLHYETCIQSLMTQVRDLRAQNLELQRSQQELSQAVASTAGISQSYGDRMTQILTTLAKFDAVVQGYQQDSKAVEASVSDHFQISNSNTAKCFSAVETLVTHYAAVASGIDALHHWFSTPAEPDTVIPTPRSASLSIPDPEPAAPTAPMGAASGPSGGGYVLPFSVHPSRDCIYHPNSCPDSGWPRGGEEHHKDPHHQEPTSWRGTAEEKKEPAIPEWRAAPKGEKHPIEPTAPWTSAKENTSSSANINPLTENVFTSPGKTSYTPFHPTNTCTVSPVKVAPSASGGATPNHGSPCLPPVPNAYGVK